MLLRWNLAAFAILGLFSTLNCGTEIDALPAEEEEFVAEDGKTDSLPVTPMRGSYSLEKGARTNAIILLALFKNREFHAQVGSAKVNGKYNIKELDGTYKLRKSGQTRYIDLIPDSGPSLRFTYVIGLDHDGRKMLALVDSKDKLRLYEYGQGEEYCRTAKDCIGQSNVEGAKGGCSNSTAICRETMCLYCGGF